MIFWGGYYLICLRYKSHKMVKRVRSGYFTFYSKINPKWSTECTVCYKISPWNILMVPNEDEVIFNVIYQFRHGNFSQYNNLKRHSIIIIQPNTHVIHEDLEDNDDSLLETLRMGSCLMGSIISICNNDTWGTWGH